jgi:transcriptional regulator GlxA family with amidase domain
MALSDPAVVGALERIHADPMAAWAVARLAGHVGMSRAAFARRCAQAVGEPPLTYLTRWRMTLAGRPLRESDLMLDAVGRAVGYASEFAFAPSGAREADAFNVGQAATGWIVCTHACTHGDATVAYWSSL